MENVDIHKPEGWIEVFVMTADVEDRRYGTAEQFAQFLTEKFEGKGPWITQLALDRLEEMIEEYSR